ncbi:hypothetical protein V490_06365 [Pseudogymnoascus sp. VKM F-3557]|nr:hypothetical protein V490_06365 [Pseudogymnoascus sp. VKM F-3557]
MSSSNFKIVPCEPGDMAVCVDIFDEAFAGDPAITYLHPRSDPKVLKEKSLQNFEKSFTAPGVKYFKAILEDTGEIVAFSKWVYPHTPDPNAEDPETAIRTQQHVPGSNNELVVEFFTKFLRGRRKWIVPETHYFMSILAVRPEYQRKGLGSMLLAPVLEQVDKENAKAFVQGSAQGVGLYLKHGWVEVDEILMDYSPYGGAKDVKTALLGCLSIPLPRCIRSLVKAPPVPMHPSRNADVLNLIRKFGERYNRGVDEIRQACNLATGCSDVVVILERPARRHDYSVNFETFVADCPSLDAVDKLVRFATQETRSIQDVSVFDAYSFKPMLYTNSPSDEECHSLLEQMLKVKKPRVVICCWSKGKATCYNQFVGQFTGGGVGRQPTRVDVDTEWGPCVAIKSFHPATAVCHNPYNADYRALLIYHFIAAFLQLRGRTEEPAWLEQIKIESKRSMRSSRNDHLSDDWERDACNRITGNLHRSIGMRPRRYRRIEKQKELMNDLLGVLESSWYRNGSTYMSNIFLLWYTHYKSHPRCSQRNHAIAQRGSLPIMGFDFSPGIDFLDCLITSMNDPAESRRGKFAQR